MLGKQALWFTFFMTGALFSAVWAEEEKTVFEPGDSLKMIGWVVKSDYFTCESSNIVQFTIRTEEEGKGLEVCQLDRHFKIKNWSEEIYGVLVPGINVVVHGRVFRRNRIIIVNKLDFPEIERSYPPAK